MENQEYNPANEVLKRPDVPSVSIPKVQSDAEILAQLEQQRKEDLAKMSRVQRAFARFRKGFSRIFPETGSSNDISERTGKNRT